MAQDMMDIDNAVRAVQDPLTSADDLALIAYYHPSLRAAAAVHPNAYPATKANVFGTTEPGGNPPVAPTPWDVPTVWPLLPQPGGQDVYEPPRELAPALGSLPSPQAPASRSRGGIALGLAAILAIGGIFGAANQGFFDRGTVIDDPPGEQWVPPDADNWPGAISVQVFGGSGDDTFTGVALAPDGTIAVVGDTNSPDGDFPTGVDDYDTAAGVIGLANAETMAPRFATGDPGTRAFWGVTTTPDGDLAVTGSTSSKPSSFVAKYTTAGQTIWHSPVDGTSHSGAPVVSPDGSLTVGTDQPRQIVRLAPGGKVQWTTNLTDALGSQPYAIAAAPDGGIVAVVPFGPDDAWDCRIIKLDAKGKVKWTKTLDGSGPDYPEAVTVTPEGNIVLAGWTGSSDGDFADTMPGAFVAELTPEGDLMWVQTVGAEGGEFAAVAVNDDTIAAVGNVNDSGDHDYTSASQGLIATFDLGGNTKESGVFGTDGAVQLHGVAFEPDGSFLVVGQTTATEGDWQAIEGGTDAVLAEVTPG